MKKDEIEAVRKACRATADVLDYLTPFVKPGVTTNGLDVLAFNFIVDHGGVPANLGYKGFPASLCTSVNDVIAHGIPSDYELKDGDIMNIDVAVKLHGYFGDASRMFCIGNVSAIAQTLVDETRNALWRAIYEVHPKKHIGDIGAVIMEHARQFNFGVVANYSGHGVGKMYHQSPEVPHVGLKKSGAIIKAGTIFTIEPMLNIGAGANHVLDDNWTVVTNDGSLSAQWEHTLLVTNKGFEILTLGANEEIPEKSTLMNE